MAISPEGARKLDLIVAESREVPKWTWQLITSGGWNTDQGDWVSRDGHYCGANYGNHGLPIIKKTLTISNAGELGKKEAGVTALESFFTARAYMYQNVCGHQISKIGEMMHVSLGKRTRETTGAQVP
jgi:HD superfamily phosphohydrolase